MSPQKLTTIILGVNKPLIDNLKKIIVKAGYEVAATIDNIAAALEYIFTSPPNFIIITFELKGQLSSMKLVEKLQFLDIPFIIVQEKQNSFAYIYPEKSPHGWIWYFPFTITSLRHVLDSALMHSLSPDNKEGNSNGANEAKKHLFFKHKSIFVKIPINQLLYIKSKKNYITAFTPDKELVSKLKISAIEKMLHQQYFLRIHRSYIINISKITAIELSNRLLYIGTTKIPIGRAKKQLLLEKISLFL